MRDTEELIQALAQSASIVKPAPHPAVLSFKWLAWATAYLALLLLIAHPRPDWQVKMQEPWFLFEIAVLVVLLVSAVAGAAFLSFPDLFQKRHFSFAPLAALVLFGVVLYLAWVTQPASISLSPDTYVCTLCIALAALLPAAWSFKNLRRQASTHSKLAGGMVMLFAFCLGALWLRLSEPTDSILHVIQWHYLPMLGFAVTGFWLGKKFLKW